MPRYRTLAAPHSLAVPNIKKSRFLGHAAPIGSKAEAEAFVDAVRAQWPDARHHCFAWRLAEGDQGFRTHDAGEPGGTGGKPILTHIDGAALCGVVVVVSRWFGGIKLGKGGLIRAYGGTAGAVLADAEIIEVVRTLPCQIVLDYSDQGPIERVLRAHGIEAGPTDFGARVTLSVAVPVDLVDSLKIDVNEATAGRVQLLGQHH